MPLWVPKPLTQDAKANMGDTARNRPAPRGFETALPSENALSNMGIGSESSQGLRSYQSGSVFTSAQGEFVNVLGIPAFDPERGTFYIDRVAVDLAAGAGQNLGFLASISGGPNESNGIVYFPPQQVSESSSSLDLSKSTDAAQQDTTSTPLDGGQDKPEGGEVTQSKKDDDKPINEGAQPYTPAVNDGVEEQQTYAHPEDQANINYGDSV